MKDNNALKADSPSSSLWDTGLDVLGLQLAFKFHYHRRLSTHVVPHLGNPTPL